LESFEQALQELVVEATEPFDALESEFEFVLVNAFFDIGLSVTQHAVDQPCQMMCHGHDCLWGAKSGSQAPVLGSERAFTVGQTLSAKPQGVGSTIVNLARRTESSKLEVSAGYFCSAFQRLMRRRNSRAAFLLLK
jgi:hypothetical protein